MTGKKKLTNMREIRAYIKGRAQLSIKPVDIQCKVCDIFEETQMSYRTICRWVAKFRRGYQQLKDAQQQQQLKVTSKKMRNILQKDARFPVRQLARLTNLS